MTELVFEVGQEAPVVEVKEPLALDTMTLGDLHKLCKEKGIVRYSKLRKEVLIPYIQDSLGAAMPAVEAPALEEAEAVEEPEAAPAPKAPFKWQDSFISELTTICENLEALPESDFLPEDLSRIITTVSNAQTVEALADCSDDTLQGYINKLKQDLPKYQRQVHETVALISKATPMTVEVDYV